MWPLPKIVVAFALWGGPRIEQVQQEAIHTAQSDRNRSAQPATAQKEERLSDCRQLCDCRAAAP